MAVPKSPAGVRPRFASVDTTKRCTLRCHHCYYFRNPGTGPDLGDDEFVAALAKWKEHTDLDCMLWLGGEPFLRPDVVRRGTYLFSRNAAFTSGTVPIPDDVACGVVISLDGPSPENDGLRGHGSFRKAIQTLGGVKERLIHCTLTPQNVGAIDTFTAQMHGAGAAGVIFGLYSPGLQERSSLVLDGASRDIAVDLVRSLRQDYGQFVLNTPSMIDWMETSRASMASEQCPYRTGEAIALDHRLRVKRPCSYGPGADCSRCGCVALFLRAAAKSGDQEARATLEALFKKA